MSRQVKYLLTVDEATGVAVRLQRLGEAGELTEVPLSALSLPRAAPVAPAPITLNFYLGGAPTAPGPEGGAVLKVHPQSGLAQGSTEGGAKAAGPSLSLNLPEPIGPIER